MQNPGCKLDVLPTSLNRIHPTYVAFFWMYEVWHYLTGTTHGFCWLMRGRNTGPENLQEVHCNFSHVVLLVSLLNRGALLCIFCLSSLIDEDDALYPSGKTKLLWQLPCTCSWISLNSLTEDIMVYNRWPSGAWFLLKLGVNFLEFLVRILCCTFGDGIITVSNDF